MIISIKDIRLWFCLVKWIHAGRPAVINPALFNLLSACVAQSCLSRFAGFCWQMLGWRKKKNPFKLVKSLFLGSSDELFCIMKLSKEHEYFSRVIFHLKLYITGVYKQNTNSITEWGCVFVLLSTPGLVSALHLPDCFHSKLLPTCHLHVGHILFKCLLLSRGAFQNRHPADLELCTYLDEVWADATITIIKLILLPINFHL